MEIDKYQNAYAVIPTVVFLNKNLIGRSTSLYGLITSLTNTKGYCWAKNDYLAKLLGVSSRQIQRWLRLLLSEELLTIEGAEHDRKIYISSIRNLTKTTTQMSCQKIHHDIHVTPTTTYMSPPTYYKNINYKYNNSCKVSDIFNFWRSVMKHPRSKLDPKRKKIINQAFDWGYESDDLKAAIYGCSLTPHNMGQNDRGERYDGLELILRNADQIDRFTNNALNPPEKLSKDEKRKRGNLASLQEFMSKEVV